ncbi:thiol-disulfide isomerase/thioredoxin [Amorphus suaedae]
MSEPARTSPRPRRRSALAAALVSVGIVAGVGAVYVTGGFAGNGGGGQCAAAAAMAGPLDAAAQGTVAGFKPLATPVDLSTLSFKNGDGKDVTIADFAGRTVLLNLWATWCPPCRAEMPSLDALEKRMGGGDFQVVAVSVDTKDDGRAQDFYRETGISSLDFFIEPTMKMFAALKKEGLALGMPTTLILDRQGCAAGVLSGPAEWDSPEAVGLVRAALDAQP